MKPYAPPQNLKRIDGEESFGWVGMWVFYFDRKKQAIIRVSDGVGWEHVSVHIRKRNNAGKVTLHTPSWDEMCVIKDLFWTDEETVIQFHPAKSDYVNLHPNVLHLWRPLEQSMPTPPTGLV